MEKTDRLQTTEALSFNCEKCGECCRHIDEFIEIWPHQQNGVCNFLMGDLCSIYKNRPALCDFERAYKLLSDYMTEQEYHEKTILHCEQLKKLRRKDY